MTKGDGNSRAVGSKRRRRRGRRFRAVRPRVRPSSVACMRNSTHRCHAMRAQQALTARGTHRALVCTRSPVNLHIQQIVVSLWRPERSARNADMRGAAPRRTRLANACNRHANEADTPCARGVIHSGGALTRRGTNSTPTAHWPRTRRPRTRGRRAPCPRQLPGARRRARAPQSV